MLFANMFNANKEFTSIKCLLYHKKIVIHFSENFNI